MITATAATDTTRATIRTAEDVGTKLDYTTSLLNTFIDQWDDLKRAAETDRNSSDQWRLFHEFERVSGRMENLLNLTDELLNEIKRQDETIIRALMKDL